MRSVQRILLIGALVVGMLGVRPASAVILFHSDRRNTNPPVSLLDHGPHHGPQGPGDPRRLLDSGWQWQGNFGSFLGTPIAPQYFITASHFGGAPNFVLNGTTYSLDASFGLGGWVDDPASDLRIWKINGAFPSWAPLYNESVGSEVNRPMVVFGRGASRGAEVRVNGELKGWQWASFDSVKAWGENTVSGVFNAGPSLGLLLGFAFDRTGGPNEAALAAGDSGGAVFIQSGGQWKLAGINYGVDGPFRFTQTGASFDGSMFDMGGLWVGGGPTFIPDGTTDVPGRSYSTAISSNLGWIQSIIGAGVVPEPSVGLTLIAFAALAARRRRSVQR